MYDTGVHVIPAGDEGQCRNTGPADDFRWPLTKGGDWCAGHRTGATTTNGGADALARVEADLLSETLGAGPNGEASPAQKPAARSTGTAARTGARRAQA